MGGLIMYASGMDEMECRNYGECATLITGDDLRVYNFVTGESGETYCSTSCAGEWRDLDPEG